MNQEYRQHDRAFYCDGNKRVDYCRVCGAEDLELSLECSGNYIEKEPKKIDIDTEPY